MLEYAPMLHVSYYAQSYVGIIRQGLILASFLGRKEKQPVSLNCMYHSNCTISFQQ